MVPFFRMVPFFPRVEIRTRFCLESQWSATVSPLSHLGSQMPAGSSKDDQIIVDDSPPVSSNTRSKTAGRTADLDDHMKELTKICEDKNVGQEWTGCGQNTQPSWFCSPVEVRLQRRD